jgi:malate dehydrogenase (oxaloacetate-decarboxylating)(NADP+)
MIYGSGEALAESLLPKEREHNWLYPDIRRIRDVSVIVTRHVIRAAQKDGVDRELALRNLSDEEIDEYIRHRMYDPFTEHEKVDEEIRELASLVGSPTSPVVKQQPVSIPNGRARSGSELAGKER